MSEEIKQYLIDLHSDYKAYTGNQDIPDEKWLMFITDAYLFLQYLSMERFASIVLNPKFEVAVDFALMKIVELDFELDDRKKISKENLGITNESVKSHSITYASTNELVEEWERDAHGKKVQIAGKYLQTSGIFHRGLISV